MSAELYAVDQSDDYLGFAIEPWAEFRESASGDVPCIVEGVWPEDAFGWVAGPPKARKTWLAIELGIAVATGTPFLGEHNVPNALPVLYVALEGHRAAIRARVGCVTRGRGIDPDGDGLDNLHLIYKPPGVNLSDPKWAAKITKAAARVGARLVIVDVLRAAAPTMRENDAGDFAQLRSNLTPLAADGRAVAMLHHFGKLNETTKERAPAERMSGTGAMRGAADVGLYLTGEADSPVSRVDVEARDMASPDAFGFRLTGEGTGTNGSFTYMDACRLAMDTPGARVTVKASAEQIAEFVREGDFKRRTPKEIRDRFDISDRTLRERRPALLALGIEYESAGALSRYVVAE
jgi:hypothetical protein